MKPLNKFPILIISGPVGVGKTSVAQAISDVLVRRSVPHGVIDLDALRQCFPRPADDPFHSGLGYKNLSVVWENYQREGARYLIIPNVTEDRSDLAKIRAAIPEGDLTVVLLKASLKTIQERLSGRETGDSLSWHISRASELLKKLADAGIADFVVDTDDKTISVVAAEIGSLVGWLND